MTKLTKYKLYLILTALLVMASVQTVSAEVGPNDLRGEDKAAFDKFRDLFQNGTPDTFYKFAGEYEVDLKNKGYMMLYYKLQNNEGFYALRHNMIYRAMQVANRLDKELHENKARDYYYLATGLLGDIYFVSHDRDMAERYFTQALEEAGERDPKFTMRCCQSLAEMLSLKDSEKALEWADKALTLAEKTDNTEYYSLSLAIIAYIHFLDGNSEEFYQYHERYYDQLSMDKPGFNHRYDKLMEIAKLAFDGDYSGAEARLTDKGTVYVDSSLVSIRIFAMERDLQDGFETVKRCYLEMDSVYSVMQNANFDQMAAERSLMHSKEETEISKRKARNLANWLLLLVVVFMVVYVMGRRRLMLKIKQRNAELKDALAKAEESDHMKAAFIRSMSHEIRTPLNAVAGFSELICTPDLVLSAEEKQDMQARISNNVNQITTIINELLELSKSESESKITEEDKEDVWCNKLGRTLLQEVKGRQKQGVELRFSTNEKDDFILRTNTHRLKNALNYLIDNAIKFTDSGHVELRSEKQSDTVVFSVTDTGVGIKAEDRGRIFEAFSKVDDFKEGIGLGLSICRRLVESLGGTVQLDTDYTTGCRFLVTIPYES